MKTYLFAGLTLLTIPPSIAAEMPPLKFGQEKIGVPPLSLAEGLAQNRNQAKPPQFATPLPRPATGDDASPLSPNLLPRKDQIFPREPTLARRSASPRVVRSPWGMPIIEPSDAVDYKMVILPTNPNLDAKMIIKDPTPQTEAPAPK